MWGPVHEEEAAALIGCRGLVFGRAHCGAAQSQGRRSREARRSAASLGSAANATSGDIEESLELALAAQQAVGIGQVGAVDEGEDDLLIVDLDHADVAPNGFEERVIVVVAEHAELDALGGGGHVPQDCSAQGAHQPPDSRGVREEMLGKGLGGESGRGHRRSVPNGNGPRIGLSPPGPTDFSSRRLPTPRRRPRHRLRRHRHRGSHRPRGG